MTFREKSAWIMTVALLLSCAFYVNVVVRASSALGRIAPPFPPVILVAVIISILIAIVGHGLAAVWAPREADARVDERDRIIAARAGRLAGVVLTAGVIVSLGLYLVTYDGNLLFHGVVASLVLAQLAEYGVQIFRYRTVA